MEGRAFFKTETTYRYATPDKMMRTVSNIRACFNPVEQNLAFGASMPAKEWLACAILRLE
jgi:hypothetical protein